MMSNLLLAKDMPEHINVAATNIDYPTLNEILKKHNIFYHCKSNNLFFFGDGREVKNLLSEKGHTCQILDPIPIGKSMLTYQWDIVRVPLYKALRYFFWKKGFYRHPQRTKRRVYMVEHENYGEAILIRKDYRHYVHEALEYKLEIIGDDVYLALVPTVVLSIDGRLEVLSGQDASGLYTQANSQRWNSVARNMLRVWVDYLCDSDVNSIVVPIPHAEKNLVFENEFQEIEERIEGVKTLGDFFR